MVHDIFNQKVRLGLDLQGGIHLQYKSESIQPWREGNPGRGTIEERLIDEAKVKAVATPRTGTTADELTTIDVRFENEADAAGPEICSFLFAGLCNRFAMALKVHCK